MIHMIDNIWIGDSSALRNVPPLQITTVLNVASDLYNENNMADVEYMQVGLIDGPGNSMSLYYSAILALAAIVKKNVKVLVCCHSCTRSLAVVIMYLNSVGESFDNNWDSVFQMLQERVDIDLPVPNEVHKEAFNKINWDLLKKLVREE